MTTKISAQKPLRHVVIGAAGVVFPSHRDAIRATGGELLAISDLNIEAGQKRAAESDCAFFADHREMLRATQPDIVVITTPHPFHCALAIEALGAGFHVLVEKPVAVEASEADAMIEAARAANRVLAVNFQQRLRPEIRAARQLIASGRLGKILHIELVGVWNRTPAYYRSGGWRGTWSGEGGGILLNQAPHDLDLLCFLLGKPARVLALTRTLLHEIEVEDTVQGIVEWPDGVLGSLHFSTAEAGIPRKLEISGTGGRLQIDEGHAVFHAFEKDLRDAMAVATAIEIALPTNAETLELEPGAGDHTAVYRNLHAALRGEEALSCDGVGARDSLELANALIFSSHREKFVTLPLDRNEYSKLLQELRDATEPTPKS